MFVSTDKSSYKILHITFAIFWFLLGGFCQGCLKTKLDEPIIKEERASFFEYLGENTATGRNGISRRVINQKGDITEVFLYGKDVNDKNLKIISTLPLLRHLSLACVPQSRQTISPQTFRYLQDCTSLRSLFLYGSIDFVTREMCEEIAKLSVILISFDYCIVDEEGLKLLSMNKKTIQGNYRVSMEALTTP